MPEIPPKLWGLENRMKRYHANVKKKLQAAGTAAGVISPQMPPTPLLVTSMQLLPAMQMTMAFADVTVRPALPQRQYKVAQQQQQALQYGYQYQYDDTWYPLPRTPSRCSWDDRVFLLWLFSLSMIFLSSTFCSDWTARCCQRWAYASSITSDKYCFTIWSDFTAAVTTFAWLPSQPTWPRSASQWQFVAVMDQWATYTVKTLIFAF